MFCKLKKMLSVSFWLAAITLLLPTILVFGGQNSYISFEKSVELVTLDENSTLICSNAAESQKVVDCYFESPSKQVLAINNDGSVSDNSTGEILDEYEGQVIFNGTIVEQCTLSLKRITEKDLGDWGCLFYRESGVTNWLRGMVNLRTDGNWPEYEFLPKNTIPQAYEIDLVVKLDPEFSTLGHFKIQTHVTLDFVHDGTLILDAKDIDLDEDSLILESFQGHLQLEEISYNFDRERILIHYITPAVDASFPLNISGNYKGILQERDSYGLYKDFYVERATGESRYLAATAFEPNYAHMAFPCLDEPTFKATFKMRIGRKSDQMSLNNMPLIESGSPVDGLPDYEWDTYKTTKLTSTYLVAFAVGQFASTETSFLPQGQPLTVWARPDAIQDGFGVFSSIVESDILDTLQSVLNVKYMLPKLDQIAYPHKNSAMENWGFIAFAEVLLLIDEQTTGEFSKERVLKVQVHEMAHQWFGDLVTMKWWDQLWLNEGFAEYMKYVVTDFIAPLMKISEQFYTSNMWAVFRDDANANSPAILAQVTHPEYANFGDITYKKGASIIRMMEHFLMQPTFFKGLNRYLNQYAYSNSDTSGLLAVLEQTGHEDGTLNPLLSMSTIMQAWLYEPNYPLLKVERNYDTGQVSLRQERFLTGSQSSDEKWFIPLTYTIIEEGLTNFNATYSNLFLEPNSQLNFQLGHTDCPVIFNLQSVGFYRVDYDETNWQRLISLLVNDDHTVIHPINRASLLFDAFSLALAEKHPFTLALNISAYLPKETEFVPLSSAISVFKELVQISELDGDGQAFKEALYQELRKRLETFGMDEVPFVGHTDHLLQRELLIAVCGIDDPLCVEDVLSKMNKWMQEANPDDPFANPFNRQARDVLYCTASRNGDASTAQFLQERLSNAWAPHENEALRNAIQDCAPDVHKGTKRPNFVESLSRVHYRRTN